MIKTLTLSLFLCFIFILPGCKSSYFQPSEVDVKPTIVNKVVHIENVNGYHPAKLENYNNFLMHLNIASTGPSPVSVAFFISP